MNVQYTAVITDCTLGAITTRKVFVTLPITLMNGRPRTPQRVDAEKLFAYAVKSLASRAQSIAELRAKLTPRAEHAADVDTVLGRLREYGYLNEQRFAENFVLARRDTDGLGRARVLMDLRKRRVAPQVAEVSVNAAYQDTDETVLIERYLRRKFRNADRETLFASDQELASAYGRLRRAGFSSGASVKVLKRFAKNPELLDVIEDSGDAEREPD